MNTVVAWVWTIVGIGLSVRVGPVEGLLAFLIATVWVLIDAVEKRGKDVT